MFIHTHTYSYRERERAKKKNRMSILTIALLSRIFARAHILPCHGRLKDDEGRIAIAARWLKGCCKVALRLL